VGNVPDAIDPRVREVFRRALRVDAVSLDATADTLEEWDSLAHLGLVAEIEREFNLQLTPDEVMSMVSVRLVLDVLGGRGVLGEA
jgi:acyl carrier protein